MKTKKIGFAALAALLSALAALSVSVRAGTSEEDLPPAPNHSNLYNSYNNAYNQSHQAVVDDANTKAATTGQGKEEEDSGSCA